MSVNERRMILQESIDIAKAQIVGLDLLEAEQVRKHYQEILQLVAQMRKAQKAYFKSRKQTDLIESKRLETAVDMRLSGVGIRVI